MLTTLVTPLFHFPLYSCVESIGSYPLLSKMFQTESAVTIVLGLPVKIPMKVMKAKANPPSIAIEIIKSFVFLFKTISSFEICLIFFISQQITPEFLTCYKIIAIMLFFCRTSGQAVPTTSYSCVSNPQQCPARRRAPLHHRQTAWCSTRAAEAECRLKAMPCSMHTVHRKR